jgi:UDP-2,3-diacylglucosamine hydrolase
VWWSSNGKEPIGLIAGQGHFPLIFAQAASSLKKEIVLFGIKGYTDKAVEKFASSSHYLDLGGIEELLEKLKQHRIKKVVLAGGIPKREMYNPGFKMDETTKNLISKPSNKGDDHLLKAFEILLRVKGGVSVIDSRHFLKDIIAPKKVMTKRKPTDAEWKDLQFGWKVSKGIGKMDIGQTVVVKQGVVLAVEALEGTDQAIKRGGQLGHGQAVVVKTCKPNQGLRFDLPCVGPETLASLKSSSSQVLGVEAGKTLMLFKDKLIDEANKLNITLVGL